MEGRLSEIVSEYLAKAFSQDQSNVIIFCLCPYDRFLSISVKGKLGSHECSGFFTDRGFSYQKNNCEGGIILKGNENGKVTMATYKEVAKMCLEFARACDHLLAEFGHITNSTTPIIRAACHINILGGRSFHLFGKNQTISECYSQVGILIEGDCYMIANSCVPKPCDFRNEINKMYTESYECIQERKCNLTKRIKANQMDED